MNFSVEVECGYIYTDGGNFDGVCHGIDQAVSFSCKLHKKSKIKHLSPKSSCKFWDFILDNNKTPGCIITCQAKSNTKIF